MPVEQQGNEWVEMEEEDKIPGNDEWADISTYWGQIGLEKEPEASIRDQDPGHSVLSFGSGPDGEQGLPSIISYTNPEYPLDVKYYRVDWQLTPQIQQSGKWENYQLTVNDDGNWYYVLLTQFKFDVNLRWEIWADSRELPMQH